MATNYYGSDLESGEESSGISEVESDHDVEDEEYDYNKQENSSSLNLNAASSELFESTGPYSDEPLADDDWIEEYNKERQRIEKHNKELEDRLSGATSVDLWCRCGNCRVDRLQHAPECQC
ncbi:hypothetical protein QZH41_003205 [Actinostola sp. cb2023]|nr:hypothetical protein QZH41_003205 [Actinostola sp. cb2023]